MIREGMMHKDMVFGHEGKEIPVDYRRREARKLVAILLFAMLCSAFGLF